MMTARLQRAIQLIKEGKQLSARDLLLEEIKANPENITAWLWALEVAANEKEQRLVLGRILKIDPAHQAALAYLKKLDSSGASPPDQIAVQEEPSPAMADPRRSGMLGLFLDWLGALPSGIFFIALFLVIVAGVFTYTRVNTSFFGLTGTDFEDLAVSSSYELIASEEYQWEVQFESLGTTAYTGTVRHAAPIRIKEFAILTHDILITTGEFADPKVVKANVYDHKFFWKSSSTRLPQGKINLIHALPANREIYQQLLEINKWDQVQITGREIFLIQAFGNDASSLGTWQDAGCNTLLVESVTILED